jgi:hypothetical protein
MKKEDLAILHPFLQEIKDPGEIVKSLNEAPKGACMGYGCTCQGM